MNDFAAEPGSPDSRPDGAIVNALSFDIEDWFHLVDIDSVSNTADWPGYPSIVERRTDEILGICEEFGAASSKNAVATGSYADHRARTRGLLDI